MLFTNQNRVSVVHWDLIIEKWKFEGGGQENKANSNCTDFNKEFSKSFLSSDDWILKIFRPKSRTAGVKTGLKSPKELLERQINDLEGRVDTLNTELAQVMKTESEMNVTVDQMEQDKNVSEDRVEEVRQKLANAELQKDNLLKKVDYLEEEIKKKRKELNTLDN